MNVFLYFLVFSMACLGAGSTLSSSRLQKLLVFANEAGKAYAYERLNDKNGSSLGAFLNSSALDAYSDLKGLSAEELIWVQKQIYVSQLYILNDINSGKRRNGEGQVSIEFSKYVFDEIARQKIDVFDLTRQIQSLNEARRNEEYWIAQWQTLSPANQFLMLINRDFENPFSKSQNQDFYERKWLEMVFDRMITADQIYALMNSPIVNQMISDKPEYLVRILRRAVVLPMDSYGYCTISGRVYEELKSIQEEKDQAEPTWKTEPLDEMLRLKDLLFAVVPEKLKKETCEVNEEEDKGSTQWSLGKLINSVIDQNNNLLISKRIMSRLIAPKKIVSNKSCRFEEFQNHLQTLEVKSLDLGYYGGFTDSAGCVFGIMSTPQNRRKVKVTVQVTSSQMRFGRTEIRDIGNVKSILGIIPANFFK